MSDNDNARGPRFGIDWRLFLTFFTLTLVVLKLTGLSTLSWWFVLMPLLIPFAFWVFLLVLGAVLIKASRLFKGEKK